MTLFEIASLFQLQCEKELTLSGVCIDSRQTKPGNLFVAIQGERFDGHDFAHEAVANGAAAIICNRQIPDIGVPQLQVPDTLKALTTIAAFHRQQFTCPVIALTGSNGKTTVKEMIAAILPKPAHATPGNLNNHIGVPLAVLQFDATHRYAVFELGANHPGEIAHTVSLVQPQVALINNIAPAHIEGFGSIDGVAGAKGEIYQGIVKGGTAIVNDDDRYAHFWDQIIAHKKILRFSAEHFADIYARDITLNQQGQASFVLITPDGEAPLQLQVAGEHNVRNALAAATCCYAVGISLPEIVSALSQFGGIPGRMTFLTGKNQAVIIDDTYNANLRSVLVALDVLGKREGQRIFVFGDMGELGTWTKEHHEAVGEAARKHGIDAVMTCGVHSQFTSKIFGNAGKHYTTHDELAQDLLNKLDAQTTVLVKGSRASAMERIVHQLVS